jgi:hypothetical protein
LRRRLIGDGAQRDFPVVEQLAIAGATDYVAELIPVGMVSEAFPDSGIGFSFATDRPEAFRENDLRLIEAVLPAIALANMADTEHTIAADSSTTRCRGELMQFGHGRRRHPITFGPVLPRPRSWSVRRHQLASAGPRLLPSDTERIDDSDEVGYRLGP